MLGTAVAWLLSSAGLVAAERWVVCYTDRPDAFALADYDVVVLDVDRHPPLAPIVERRKTVLAYLSLTQIGKGRSSFSALRRAGVVLDEHPVWSDAHYLDFRRPEWTRLVIEELVPQALDRGFSGLFLDTLDDAEFLERIDPVRYKGMRAAAVRIVRTIRHHYPHVVLMANRGYAVMPEIATTIDILLGESVLATFDPATKKHVRQSAADVEWQVDALRQARARNPRLRIFTLDYWDPQDHDGLRALYREQRVNGFVPYVSTPLLDDVVAEPR